MNQGLCVDRFVIILAFSYCLVFEACFLGMCGL